MSPRSGALPLRVAYGRRPPEDVTHWAAMLADGRSVALVTRSIATACRGRARGRATDAAEAAALVEWVGWAVDDVRTRLGLLPCSPEELAGLFPARRLRAADPRTPARELPRRWVAFAG